VSHSHVTTSVLNAVFYTSVVIAAMELAVVNVVIHFSTENVHYASKGKSDDLLFYYKDQGLLISH
jgi:hypothetical protein